ncbi:hypothetical protein SAMN05192555_10422 [Franzmannia pantelleriensis]|uniref:Protein refolding chaperone Spy/CpxP family n=1 Tax=Franzmannia pantelleriensis TaxID=48727 RepID=A0A1G9JGG4_9GAMM|nr:hypothetical protein [Halomonas pantelleriensis]SDL36213.1 hypothetical protein SAMN05192555_10422 [Halomonas pantelleriensis]
MMRMTVRKSLMPALMALAIAPLSLAASAGSHSDDAIKGERYQHKHAEHLDAMQEHLGFDDDTRAELEAAHAELRDAHRELKAHEFASRDERHEAYHELHEQHRAALDEILTDEQREELRSAMREKMQEHHAERRKAMQERLTALVDSWELSDDEREALTEVRESLYADMRELREQAFDSREERRDAYRALRDEHHAALAELLDEQQLEELKATMQPKGRKHGHRHHGTRGHHPERNA